MNAEHTSHDIVCDPESDAIASQDLASFLATQREELESGTKEFHYQRRACLKYEESYNFDLHRRLRFYHREINSGMLALKEHCEEILGMDANDIKHFYGSQARWEFAFDYHLKRFEQLAAELADTPATALERLMSIYIRVTAPVLITKG